MQTVMRRPLFHGVSLEERPDRVGRDQVVGQQAVEDAGFISWDALTPSAPGLDLASARHERLPARLFAS